LPVLRQQAHRVLLVAPLTAALIALGCGSEESSTTNVSTEAPDAASFPSAKGKTLADIESEYSESDYVAAPTVSVFEEGENRYAFGLFTVNREPINDGEVAIYAAPGPDGEATGPYPTASNALATKPAFASLTTTGDPDAATNVYTTDVELDGKGEWRMLALIRDGEGDFSWTRLPSAVVGARAGAQVPDVGDPAPEIHTPTVDDVGGDLAKIDTRQPPSTQHEVDFADVLGKEPVVLSFATPALCSSRVCGPVVDIAEEVKSERPDDAEFIHMEIFEDNDANKGPNEQVRTYALPSEPWLFVIDENGKISSRIEGAYSKEELEAALDEVS
jgi:hypothetical protein